MDSAALLHANATAELKWGNEKRAKMLLENATSIDPSHGRSWMTRAKIEMKRGRVAVARELFKEGVKQCPVDVHLRLAWASLEWRQVK